MSKFISGAIALALFAATFGAIMWHLNSPSFGRGLVVAAAWVGTIIACRITDKVS